MMPKKLLRRLAFQRDAEPRTAARCASGGEFQFFRASQIQVGKNSTKKASYSSRKTAFPFSRNGRGPEIPTAFDDLRLGQVLRTSDTLGGIGQEFSRSWHGTTLPENALQAENIPEIRRCVIIKTQ
jgi:hypothetical protein